MANTDVLASEMMVVGEPGAGTQMVAQVGDDRVVQPNLPMELDSLANCLSSLQDLMMSLPSSASEVTELSVFHQQQLTDTPFSFAQQ